MTDTNDGTIRLSVDLPLDAEEAFDAVVEELRSALARDGIQFAATSGGRITQAGSDIAGVIAWEAGERALLEWRPTPWEPDSTVELELRSEKVAGGSRVTMTLNGWMRVAGSGRDAAGWFAQSVAGPLLRAALPAAVGDWLTDRRARRPAGADSRAVYRDPLYHYPGFRALLEELALGPDDYLLEVGCGGGALLRDALKSGCRAAAVDHSPDMVRVARESNADAIAAGRLEIREADAAHLPFADETFTCAVMTGVLGFLPDPVAALAEMRRVLERGGRAVVAGSDPELRGTPGAPEPMASRLRFYDSAGLEELGLAAGFHGVRVVERDLESFAREVGVPEEHVPLFAGASRFLTVRKS